MLIEILESALTVDLCLLACGLTYKAITVLPWKASDWAKK